ncbi:MAG: hypothetical protein M1569_03550 [Candidatus Marsarchaeota archaeon]|nr:hypothetical protein [Candidatus Marsarchaeota archaeon]MCL5413450.1 hypothetical protein [Candidatus Marsarchaeota archaeon]
MNKGETLYALGLLSATAGEDRLRNGNIVAARNLFRDSARKYVHRAVGLKDRTDSELRILEKALRSAVRSDDHALSFEIAMGSIKVLNGAEYVPSFKLDEGVGNPKITVDGKRTGYYSGGNYSYSIHMSGDQLSEIIRFSAEHGDLAQFLQSALENGNGNSGRTIIGEEAGPANTVCFYRINANYVNNSFLSLWSDHTGGGDSEISFINAIGDSLMLISSSSRTK